MLSAESCLLVVCPRAQFSGNAVVAADHSGGVSWLFCRYRQLPVPVNRMLKWRGSLCKHQSRFLKSLPVKYRRFLNDSVVNT